jgi:hopanoid biosynthesis associated RND transporter like protein HpnN
MIQRLLLPVVSFCHRRAALVSIIALLLTILSGVYAVSTLGIDTDESNMLSPKLDWRQREIAFDKAFPQSNNLVVVVVDGLTPDDAEDATRALTAKLQEDTTHFDSVHRPDGGPFFIKNGLLLLPTEDVKRILDKTLEAQPLMGQLAVDPSPRGLFNALGIVAQGVAMGAAKLEALEPSLTAIDKSIRSILEEDPQPLSWQNLLNGRAPTQQELQHVILVQAKLDYTHLEPGQSSTDAIRAAAADLGYYQNDDVRVRITGPVALADEQFATVAQGALAATIGSTLLVIVWLILALRSLRLIVAIMGTLVTGFALTAAFAAISVGTLNLISIAFAVLFIGIAVDFSIQFSVRYRNERYHVPDLGPALMATARTIGGPIAVAAAATAAGFYSFLPTAFQGVSELGLIAGTGMIIAFICNMTVLPALLKLMHPRAENSAVGFRGAAPIDNALIKGRWPVVALALAVGAFGIFSLPHLRFDFDPLHLKNQSTESMMTINDLVDNPLTTPYSADVLAASPEAAAALAEKLEKLPEVSHVVSINSFIPGDQAAKLALIGDASTIMSPTLNPPSVLPYPTSDEIRESIKNCREAMEAALAKAGSNPVAESFVTDLARLEKANDTMINQLGPILLGSLPNRLADVHMLLDAEPITLDSLPDEIKRDWMTEDGRARLEIYPKGDVRQNETLKKFYAAIQPIVPEATGSAITIQQSSQTIVNAFRTAGLSAILVIAMILLVALRRLTDVVLVLLPLLLAGLMTVIVCVYAPLPLNFANIIALPLLLGIGVAFDIYFVMNWRRGEVFPLQSPTARAILFSALTTGTAFGSLALSNDPGTASMGKLLIISLVATLICTLFILPGFLAMLKQPPARAPTEK